MDGKIGLIGRRAGTDRFLARTLFIKEIIDS